MPKIPRNRTKENLRPNAESLFERLGIELTREQKEIARHSQNVKQKQAERARIKRLNMPPDERARRVAEQTAKTKAKRAKETPEEREERLAYFREYQRNYYRNLSSEKRAQYIAKRIARSTERRATESEEEAIARKQRQCEYARNKKNNETPEQREKRQKYHREFYRNLPPEKRAQYNAKSIARRNERRAMESEEETIARKKRQCEYVRNKRANETPEQREARLAKERKYRAKKRAEKRAKDGV